MIRLAEIQDAFLSLVGWEQHYNPTLAISEKLTQSESGYTYQGAHPLVTLDNIRSVMPTDWCLQYPDAAGKEGTTFAAGSKVAYYDKFYTTDEATDATPGEAPWVEFNPLSDYVEKLTRDGIAKAVQRFLSEKMNARETHSLLEHRALFDGAGRLQSVITPTGSLVGLEIEPVRSMGVTTRIDRIGLQMIGAGEPAPITLYLYHSSQAAPIRTLTFTYTNRSGGFQWFTPPQPLFLPYIGSDTDAGGCWYLVYDQNELPAGLRALNRTKDWSANPCSTCDARYYEDWKQITKYLLISPFTTKATDGVLDPSLLAYTRTVNYGINLEISIGCDLTDFIIRQRGIFAPVVQKQVAATALRTIAMNPDVRVNRNQLNVTREELLYEVDGNPQGRATGLAAELERAYRALEIDTQGIDRICLQCNTGGVSYRTV